MRLLTSLRNLAPPHLRGGRGLITRLSRGFQGWDEARNPQLGGGAHDHFEELGGEHALVQEGLITSLRI